MPEAVRVSYLNYLAGNTSEECIKAKEIVADRRRLFDPLDLMDWAEMPSVELSPEQAAKNNRRAREFSEKNPYIELMKNLCKKAEVKRAFRACYHNTTGRRMRDIGGSIYVDEDPLEIGVARVVVECDCGGWDYFRGEVGVELEGKLLLIRQSICRWLGYGEMGWDWIVKDDLEEAAHVAVQQTREFRQILFEWVKKTIG